LLFGHLNVIILTGVKNIKFNTSLVQLNIRNLIMTINDRFVRLKEVVAVTTLSKSTIRRRIIKGTFPPPRDLGGGMKAWLISDINKWFKTVKVS